MRRMSGPTKYTESICIYTQVAVIYRIVLYNQRIRTFPCNLIIQIFDIARNNPQHKIMESRPKKLLDQVRLIMQYLIWVLKP